MKCPSCEGELQSPGIFKRQDWFSAYLVFTMEIFVYLYIYMCVCCLNDLDIMPRQMWVCPNCRQEFCFLFFLLLLTSTFWLRANSYASFWLLDCPLIHFRFVFPINGSTIDSLALMVHWPTFCSIAMETDSILRRLVDYIEIFFSIFVAYYFYLSVIILHFYFHATLGKRKKFEKNKEREKERED